MCVLSFGVKKSRNTHYLLIKEVVGKNSAQRRFAILLHHSKVYNNIFLHPSLAVTSSGYHTNPFFD